MELAVVGRDDFVLGFRLAGVRKCHAVEPEAMEAKVEEVVDDPEVGILVLSTEDLPKLSHGTRRRLETMARPVMIAVGAKEEEDLRAKVKRAIGIDLFK